VANAPEWFIKELHTFDSDMRCRWSPRCQMFQLERKVSRSLHPGTIRNDGWHDDYIRAQEGYILVAQVPPGKFSRTIFEKLRRSDLWSNGGWESIAKQIEGEEDREEEMKWKSFEDDVHDRSKEVYDWMKIRDGRTTFSPGWVE